VIGAVYNTLPNEYLSAIMHKNLERVGGFTYTPDELAFAEQIRPYVPGPFICLGTDGFGRSDYRKALRNFFEVDRHFVVVAALKALVDDGALPAQKVAEAIAKYCIDAERAPPWKA